jgi:hypothetical protein
MERFPEEHELISFFECEPKVLDPGIPWAYNHLEFRSVRGPDEFFAAIEPGGESVRFWWRRDEKELVNLSLEQVAGIVLEMSPECEVMVLRFRRSVGALDLRIQLKPAPHLEWGTPGVGV